jgi:hypothetical protein
MNTAHKTVTFQFAPDSDKPELIAEKLVRTQESFEILKIIQFRWTKTVYQNSIWQQL